MTLDRLAIAYAKSLIPSHRSAINDMLALVADIRASESEYRDQWRLLLPVSLSESNQRFLAWLRTQPRVSRKPFKAIRRDPSKDSGDVLASLEQEYEKLRAECSVGEIVQSALLCARLDYERFAVRPESEPDSLYGLRAEIISKHECLVRSMERFLAANAG